MTSGNGLVQLATAGGEGASGQAIILAIISGVTAITVAFIQNRPGRPPRTQPDAGAFMPTSSAPNAGRRHWGRFGLIIMVGASVAALFLFWRPLTTSLGINIAKPTPSAENSTASGPSATSSVGTTSTSPSPSVTASPMEPVAAAQLFLDDYYASYKSDPSAETLDDFWLFPVSWYNDREVPDSATLLHKYLNDGRQPATSQVSCRIGAPRVVDVDDKDNYLEYRVARTWKMVDNDRKGVFFTFYNVRRQTEGKPFRFIGVREEADSKVCK